MADFRDLLVRILGDDRDVQAALSRTEKRVAAVDSRMASFGKNVTRAFGAVGIAVGTRAVFQGMDKAVDSASKLEEQMARNEQVFDESAASVERWSERMASSFGIAQSQALEFSGTFGLLFRNIGSSAPEAEKLSKQLVELAADLASFNNTDVETALNALRSGLTGEIEPLRKFGVFLSEARAQQEAFAKTGKSTAESLTTQDKVLARFNIILNDTSRAQGDFARTSDSLANKQRIAAAEAENLAANLGRALAPAMDIALTSTIALTGGINDLVAGMGDLRSALRDSDIFEGFNAAVEDANSRAVGFFENLRDNIPLLNEVARLRGAVIGGGTDFSIPSRPEEGRGALDAAAGEAEQTAKDAARATRAQIKARKQFDEFLKGLGLKLDRAGLTTSLNDDLTVMREIEAAIKKRIAAEGRTFKLASALTEIQLRIASTVASQQVDAQERASDALEKRVEAQEAADERRRNRIRQRQERRQRQQFGELGLTGTGDKRTPSVGALRRRLGNVRDEVEGTVLDTKQTERQLDRIQAVLSGKFGKVGKAVRDAILGMLNDISSAFDEGGAKQGPLTKTSGLNTKKILEGLGLSDQEINELRGRLSSINSAGQQFATTAASRTTGGAGFGGQQGPILVESHTTINLDGNVVAKVVTKQQQKAKRRNPLQKRGPNRNR